MISYEKAKETALSIDNNINTVYEDNNSYIFSDNTTDMYNPIVVSKTTGTTLNYLDYMSNNNEQNTNRVKQLKF